MISEADSIKIMAQLPRELWVAIGEKLAFLDLWSLASSSRNLRLLFDADLQVKTDDLRIKFKEIESQGRPCSRGSKTIGGVLEMVLCREVPPSFVKLLFCGEGVYKRQEGDLDHNWGASIGALNGGASLQGAIESTPWIYEEERADFIARIVASDEEAALCLLLPMLTGLQVLRTWNGFLEPTLQRFVTRVASDPGANILPQLKVVWGYATNGEQGMSLKDLARESNVLRCMPLIASPLLSLCPLQI